MNIKMLAIQKFVGLLLALFFCVVTIDAQLPNSDARFEMKVKLNERNLQSGQFELDIKKITVPGISIEDQIEVFDEAGTKIDVALLNIFISNKTHPWLIQISTSNISISKATRKYYDVKIVLKKKFRRVKDLLEALPTVMAEKFSRERTDEEKVLMVAPFGSSPGGGGADTSIKAPLYRSSPLSSRFLTQILFDFRLDRGSSGKSETNLLNIGLLFQKTFLLGKARIGKEKGSNETFKSRYFKETAKLSKSPAENELESLSLFLETEAKNAANAKMPFFRTTTLDWINPGIESGVGGFFHGSVINFVNRSNFELSTGEINTPTLKNFFFNLRLLPISFEYGANLRDKDNHARQGKSIFRVNTGASALIKLRFPCADDIFADRIELELKGSNRHLFRKESAYDELSKTNSGVADGNKYALETSLKYVFGFPIPVPSKLFGIKLPDFRLRPAFVVTYRNGYFPPVYAHTNGVTWRFTIATGGNRNVPADTLKLSDLFR